MRRIGVICILFFSLVLVACDRDAEDMLKANNMVGETNDSQLIVTPTKTENKDEKNEIPTNDIGQDIPEISVTTVPPEVEEQEQKEIKGVQYKIENDTVIFYGTGSLMQSTVRDALFEMERDKIKNVIIEEGIVEIGEDAFARNTVPSSQDGYLFEKVEIAGSVIRIGAGAFIYCEELNEVVFKEGTKYISAAAFYGCNQLKTVKLPESIVTVGRECFAQTLWLEEMRKKDPLVIVNDILIDASTVSDTESINGISYTTKFAYSEDWRNNWRTEESLIIVNDVLIDGSKAKGEVIIPNGVKYIAEMAFAHNTEITTVNMPDTVKFIGASAFQECEALTSVRMSNNIEYIEEAAFYYCRNLSEINIPQKSKFFGKKVFESCDKLSSIEIPDGVIALEVGIFHNCFSLEDVILPDSLQYIGEEAFRYCTSLSEINMPENLITIEREAFSYCGLDTVYFPEGVVKIGSSAFSGCENLSKISIPGSVQFVGYQPFSNTLWIKNLEECVVVNDILIAAPQYGNVKIPEGVLYIGEGVFEESHIKKIEIPDSVEKIGYGAFYNCIELEEVTLPNNLKEIEDCAFLFCMNLRKINIPKSVVYIGEETFVGCPYYSFCCEKDSYAEQYAKENEIPYIVIGTNFWTEGITLNILQECTLHLNYELSRDGTCYIVTGWNGGRLETLYIPEEYDGLPIKEISYGAFEDYLYLQKVVLPDSIIKIGSSAFEGCTNLSYIKLPAYLETISQELFYSCENLREIDIPKSVKWIEDYAFEHSGLEKINFPEGLLSIGYRAFIDCCLEEIYIPASVKEIEGNVFCTDWKNECYLSKITVAKNNPYFWSKGNCLITQDGILLVGCNGSVIPDGVKIIGEDAFVECELNIVNIPKTVAEIQEGAFEFASITEISFSEGLERIEDEAFYGVWGLRKVEFPQSLKYIEDNIFSNSHFIQEVTFPRNVLELGRGIFRGCGNLEHIILPVNIKEIPDNMFKGCVEMDVIEIPNSVEIIGQSAFEECSSLEMPLLPDSLIEIKRNAFFDCDSLDEVIIPKSVVKIEGGAFGDCYSIIKCLIPSSVTSMMSDIFFWSDNVILYVEQGSVAESYAKEYGIPYIN